MTATFPATWLDDIRAAESFRMESLGSMRSAGAARCVARSARVVRAVGSMANKLTLHLESCAKEETRQIRRIADAR